MPLSTEVGCDPGDFVLDGDAFPQKGRGDSPQIFGTCLLWPKGWMYQGARRLSVRWGPKGIALNFRPMSAVAEGLDGLRCHLVWR